jgi:ligand-binding SRPBCC domain-containing protein
VDGVSDVEVSTRVGADPARVWDRVASIEGVNHELGPWLRMTAPPGVDQIDLDEVPLGKRWFRSRVLLFGVVPVDYDDLTVAELEPGRRFLERSTMFSMRVWQHERVLEPDGDGTFVTDRLTFTPRALVSKGVARRVVRAIFRHRHRRLAAWASSTR